MRFMYQISLHSERLDSFDPASIADLLFVEEFDFKVANEAIAFHLDDFVWNTLDVSAFSVDLFFLLLVLLGEQNLLFYPDFLN